MTALTQPIEKVCEHCGQLWLTRRRQSRTCSPTCRARLREIETPSAGRPERDYPEGLLEQVRELYEGGATIAEVGRVIGPGYKAEILVRRAVPQRRRAASRGHRGELCPAWKGPHAGYQALHLRVAVARGKPTFCACCDTTDPAKRYEWANLTGRYDDISDYVRLCVSCHRRLDAARRAQSGERTSPEERGGRRA